MTRTEWAVVLFTALGVIVVQLIRSVIRFKNRHHASDGQQANEPRKDDHRVDREGGGSVEADRVLFKRYGLALRLGQNDSLLLNVLCGTVGQYGVEFPLNAKERERYKREGDSYLDELERKVLANPKAFIMRGRSC